MQRFVLKRGEVEEAVKLVLRNNDSDVANNASPISHHMVPATQYKITPGCGQVFSECVHFQVVFLCELSYPVAYDLALNRKSSWRVY